MKSFDVICPVYNEQLTVPLFFARVRTMFARLDYRCHLTFIDNSSSDQTQELIREICKVHEWVSLVVMSRNFGYQSSVECGVRLSQADYTGVVDVDCEDPPEMFVGFLKLAEEGHDLVYGERLDREEIWLVKLIRKFYYRLTKATADEHFILDMAEFCVMNRMVREAVCQDRTSFPFIRSSLGRVGFAIKNVPYKRHHRVAGESHYNMWRLLSFGLAGILSSSTLWLRIPAYVFPFWAIFAIGLGLARLQTGREIYFEAMVLSALLFLGFTATGVSLYLARVYKNGLQRPNFFINHKKSLLRDRQAPLKITG